MVTILSRAAMLAAVLLVVAQLLPITCSAADTTFDPGYATRLPAATGEAQAADAIGGDSASAVFAGGCFWCVEAVFEPLQGVQEVVSGYAGGAADRASYQLVAAGRTEHAEAVRIVYDPQRIAYSDLMRVFFSLHDPTQLNRQGPDPGKQYRSAIFPQSQAQRTAANAYIAQLEQAEAFTSDIVTTIEATEAFWPAEAYHQDFVERKPGHGYVRAWALPKLEKLPQLYPELMAQ